MVGLRGHVSSAIAPPDTMGRFIIELFILQPDDAAIQYRLSLNILHYSQKSVFFYSDNIDW